MHSVPRIGLWSGGRISERPNSRFPKTSDASALLRPTSSALNRDCKPFENGLSLRVPEFCECWACRVQLSFLFRERSRRAAAEPGSDAPKAGLGTGIVEALARNLQGEIQLSDASPGTAVTISHRGDADRRTRIPVAA
jgi:hypothetical protein